MRTIALVKGYAVELISYYKFSLTAKSNTNTIPNTVYRGLKPDTFSHYKRMRSILNY